MSKKVRLLNKKTGKTIELDSGRLSFFTFLLNMRYWFAGLFRIGRPIMGLTGVALIVIVIVFGAVIDDGKGIATFAAVVYISLGIYCSVNRNKMLIQYYLKNGWVQANPDSNVKARAQGSAPVQHSSPLAPRAPSAAPVSVAVANSAVPAALPHPPLHDPVPIPFPRAAMKGAFCGACGAPAGDSKFCTHCGQPQTPSNICSRCGTQFRVGSTFCTECGAKSA
jgi:hypothetical protein